MKKNIKQEKYKIIPSPFFTCEGFGEEMVLQDSEDIDPILTDYFDDIKKIFNDKLNLLQKNNKLSKLESDRLKSLNNEMIEVSRLIAKIEEKNSL